MLVLVIIFYTHFWKLLFQIEEVGLFSPWFCLHLKRKCLRSMVWLLFLITHKHLWASESTLWFLQERVHMLRGLGKVHAGVRSAEVPHILSWRRFHIPRLEWKWWKKFLIERRSTSRPACMILWKEEEEKKEISMNKILIVLSESSDAERVSQQEWPTVALRYSKITSSSSPSQCRAKTESCQNHLQSHSCQPSFTYIISAVKNQVNWESFHLPKSLAFSGC